MNRCLMALLLIVATSQALGAEALCTYPGLTNPPDRIGKLSAPLPNGDTHWATWYLDGGLCFDTFTLSIRTLVERAMDGRLTDEEAMAYREQSNAGLTGEQRTELDERWVAERRRVFVDVYAFPPKVLEGIAYRRRSLVDGNEWQRVGRVPVDTECQRSGKAGDMMRVERRFLVPDAPTAALPTEIFARCG